MDYQVTVICTTYNHERYIQKTLDGFLAQRTTFPVEYIVRDDASTDNTAEIMREYERKYPGFFTMVYEKENQYSKHLVPGFSQKIIQNTHSEYVAFCEGDDYWCVESKLQEQVDAMEQSPNASFCIHAHYELNDKTNRLKTKHPFNKTGFLSTEDVMIEPHGMPATCSMLLRTEFIKLYPVDKLRCPVGDRNRRMFLVDYGPGIYIDKLMGVYRVNNSNSFGGKLYDYETSINLVKKMNEFFDNFNIYTGYRYSDFMDLLKERECINHWMRFKEYKNIVNTDYYKRYYSCKDKMKMLIKWKMGLIYDLYKKYNKL